MTLLYKRTNASLLSWEISISNNTVLINHGQADGKKQLDKITCDSPAKAAAEMERRIKIKTVNQGYTREIPDDIPRLPVLLSNFNPQHLPDTVILQPKLDGIRCIGSSLGLFTRRNEPIRSMPHIEYALKTLPPEIVLDGELYCSDLSFQEICGQVKRDRADYPNNEKIFYFVFDVQENSPYTERYKTAYELVRQINSQYINIVFCHMLYKGDIESTAKSLYSNIEGVVLRNPDSPYEYNTRSINVQKLKWKQAEEYQIIDITAAESGREAGLAIFLLKTDLGLTFKARPALSQRERKMIYDYKSHYIGKYTRITYEAKSNTGIPLKPRAEGIFDTPEGAN